MSPDMQADPEAAPAGTFAPAESRTIVMSNPTDFATGKSIATSICPANAPRRTISVTAVSAAALPGGKLIYNSRAGNGGALNDPTAIMYFRSADIDASGKVKAGVPIEPLVVRAMAGECIHFNLFNKLPKILPDLDGFNTMPNLIHHFNANQVRPSNQVGLHPQLLAYNVVNSDGKNVGFNPNQTIGPGGFARYTWYAGDVVINGNRRLATPIEFGGTNLISSDPIKHSNKGAIGSLIVEPQGSTWIEDANSRAQATVTKTDGTSFREFVLQFQTDINMRYADGSPVPTLVVQTARKMLKTPVRKHSTTALSRSGSEWDTHRKLHSKTRVTSTSPTCLPTRWWAAIRKRRYSRRAPVNKSGSAF
jgi:hypothetical protein